MKLSTGRKVFAIFCAIAILYHWRILIGHQYSLLTGYEAANQAYGWFTFLVRSLRTGSALLWDPYAFSGHPFIDEMQNGAFYPLNLLSALAPLNNKALFSPALYHWLYSLSHILAAWFMYLLLRELELSAFAGLAGGLGFGFGGVMARSAGWAHLFQGFIWFPLILLFLLRAMKADSVRRGALFAATAGIGIALALLAGSLYSAIVQTILAVSAVLFAVFADRLPPPRGALILGATGLTAFCGSAVQLLPSAAAGSYTLRTLGPTMFPSSDKIPYHYISSGLWAHSFLSLFLAPTAFNGNIATGGEVASPYIGVLLFLLALIGVWKRWQVRWVKYLTGVTAGAFLFSLGSVSILHGVLYALVPRLGMAREPSRMLYLADFTVAALAAFGADALFSEDSEDWKQLRAALKWLAIVCGAALVGSALFPRLEINPWLEFSVVLILATAALMWKASTGERGPAIRCLAIGLILFDLYAFDWDAANVMDAQAKNQDQLDRLMSFHGAADFLKSQPGPWRVQLLSDPVSNIGDAYGIEATWGAAATVVRDYWDYRDLNIWNTRYVIRPAAAADPGAVYADAQWKVYPNPAADPRAWLVHNVVVASTDAARDAAVRAPGFDARSTAVVSRPVGASPGASDPGDRVVLQDYRPASPVVGVYTKTPALLVLSEVDTPYWVATVNAVKTNIVRVDGALRGVPVPAGYSRVEMHYRPWPIYLGGALSVLTFAALGALWFRRPS